MGGTCCGEDRKQLEVANAHGVNAIQKEIAKEYLAAFARAEALCGHPPHAGEISALLVEENNPLLPIKKSPALMNIIFNLFRDDLLYTDIVSGRYSVSSHKGFSHFSECHERLNQGYYIEDKTQEYLPMAKTKTVNFKHLLECLKSKDATILENPDTAWMFDGHARLLDSEDTNLGQKVAYDSFPRSGNAFLRRLFEQVSGI